MNAPHVYLAVGHGITEAGRDDPGAVGNGWTEQTAGDVIVARAADRLAGVGAKVTHEAHDPDDPNYAGTAKAANRLGVDLCVAVHHDWIRAPAGAFAHWYPGSRKGQAAADRIVDAITAAGFPGRPSWHKARDLAVVRRTTMPAVLVECGPIGHATLDERPELERMGDALAAGIADALELEPVTPERDRPEPSGLFEDVAGSVHEDAVTRAYELGLVDGYPDGTYRPHEPLTRAQAATLLVSLHDLLTTDGS